MPPNERILSYECVECLVGCLRLHCPCAFDDPGRAFLRDLLAIIEEEVKDARIKERKRVFERLKRPGGQ